MDEKDKVKDPSLIEDDIFDINPFEDIEENTSKPKKRNPKNKKITKDNEVDFDKKVSDLETEVRQLQKNDIPILTRPKGKIKNFTQDVKNQGGLKKYFGNKSKNAVKNLAPVKAINNKIGRAKNIAKQVKDAGGIRKLAGQKALNKVKSFTPVDKGISAAKGISSAYKAGGMKGIAAAAGKKIVNSNIIQSLVKTIKRVVAFILRFKWPILIVLGLIILTVTILPVLLAVGGEIKTSPHFYCDLEAPQEVKQTELYQRYCGKVMDANEVLNPYGDGARFLITSIALVERLDPVNKDVVKVHGGWDMVYGGEGTPIYAVQSGTVTFAGDGGGFGPNAVAITNDEFEIWYGHMSSMCVSVGDEITAGDKVGEQGTMGHSTGTHLHLEFRVVEVPIQWKIDGVSNEFLTYSCNERATANVPGMQPLIEEYATNATDIDFDECIR